MFLNNLIFRISISSVIEQPLSIWDRLITTQIEITKLHCNRSTISSCDVSHLIVNNKVEFHMNIFKMPIRQ